jgi:hypothetical protein
MKFTNGKVLSNFVIYRYVEIALIILGIVLMYSSMNDTFWRVWLGLFIQASIVLSLDFLERRGHHYIVYLQELVEKYEWDNTLQSIADLHKLFNLGNSQHPLVAVLDFSQVSEQVNQNSKISTDLFNYV